ncbi:unnamed protein product [Ambrosiozyma monospora]|uniref:Unnamed protein product n=1 Tax=Ambrosiozyma monospora TaxID=43982 RepID=A0ACB5T9J6_AMBMO|nr:unnamed protein product [Ambrosiozyma monospora]
MGRSKRHNKKSKKAKNQVGKPKTAQHGIEKKYILVQNQIQKTVKFDPPKLTPEQEAEKIRAQQKQDIFIAITSQLPVEVQDRVFSDALVYADLLNNHKLFSDIIKESPLNYEVDLYVSDSWRYEEGMIVGWNMEIVSRYVERTDIYYYYNRCDQKYTEYLHTLGIRRVDVKNCILHSAAWCDWIPYCKEMTIRNFSGFKDWVKEYAYKISSLTVKTCPTYLNDIVKNRNSFKILKKITVEIEDDNGRPFKENRDFAQNEGLEILNLL